MKKKEKKLGNVDYFLYRANFFRLSLFRRILNKN